MLSCFVSHVISIKRQIFFRLIFQHRIPETSDMLHDREIVSLQFSVSPTRVVVPSIQHGPTSPRCLCDLNFWRVFLVSTSARHAMTYYTCKTLMLISPQKQYSVITYLTIKTQIKSFRSLHTHIHARSICILLVIANTSRQFK